MLRSDKINADILNFIQKRFPNDNNWLEGNCYYFACILKIRFPFLKKIYFPITGHWACIDKNNIIYDWTGVCSLNEKYYTEKWMRENEPDYYRNLLNDSKV